VENPENCASETASRQLSGISRVFLQGGLRLDGFGRAQRDASNHALRSPARAISISERRNVEITGSAAAQSPAIVQNAPAA
jgi:hypothetical protein